MKSLNLLLFCCCLAFFTQAQDIPTFSPDDINIPYKKFVLDNGLTLIVHEDHKAPIVAVNVWYHVGSKNEKPGKSGFAHLFEHLMFNGSENFNDDYFQVLERIGGTDLNGTTNTDRTNYFQNVPVAAFDQVLWLESDRMGHLLGAIDQAKLDEQRGVVQNEKRQGENQPYGRQWDILTKEMHPKGHPYSWTVIGEMEHLNAASLEDVHEWFKTYYGAANAVLSIAGDVNTEEVVEKVKKYFGNIAPGPTLVRPDKNIPVRLGETRKTYEDRVPESRITMAWNTPEWGSKESEYLALAAFVMSRGKNARLYKKLIYEDQIASSAFAFQSESEISSNFIMQANVKPGKSVAEVEAAMDAVLAEFLKNGPTEEELKRVKAQYFAGFIKGIERIGGFGGKSDILAQCQVYGGDPEFYKESLQTIADATVKDVQMAAKKWLTKGRFVLTCNPFPELKPSGVEADRSKMPEMGKPAVVAFPDLQETTLSNGMKVVLARREGIPTIQMNMMFDAGYSSDITGKPGTASLAMNMMDEGTEKMSSLEINELTTMMGASIGAYSDLDMSYVSMNTLKPSLDASLSLYSDIILRPAFPDKEFERLKKEQMARIQREKAQPTQMAMRVMPQFLYDKGHPYSLPMTGSGTEESVSTMNLDDVKKFYGDWIKPNNATLVVVGDLTMDELKAKLEKNFSSWKKGKTPKKNMADMKSTKGNVLYLMDRPESQQSVIMAGDLIPGYGDNMSEIARETFVNVFGGEFTSRLNMNLREDKHWAYGAYTFLMNAKGPRPMVAYAPVQTDKTKESVIEIKKEMEAIMSVKPVTAEEFKKTTENTILQLPGQWETNGSVSGSVVNVVKYGLKKDYYQKYGDMVRNLSLDDVNKVSKQVLQPDEYRWFIVGDKEKILPGLKELGFDKIVLVDPDGKPLEEIKTKVKP